MTETTDQREQATKIIVIECNQQPSEQPSEQPAEQPAEQPRCKRKLSDLPRTFTEKVLHGRYTEDGKGIELPYENDLLGRKTLKRKNAPDKAEYTLVIAYLIESDNKERMNVGKKIFCGALDSVNDSDPDSFKKLIHKVSEYVKTKI